MSADRLIEIIHNSRKQRHVCHFTDEINFPSIRQHGLVSKKLMREEGWRPPLATGGNELSHRLDTIKDIDPYVSLCFTTNHGMAFHAKNDGRLPNLRYLGINPQILKTDGAKITFGVANSDSVEIPPADEAVERLDTEVINKYTDR